MFRTSLQDQLKDEQQQRIQRVRQANEAWLTEHAISVTHAVTLTFNKAPVRAFMNQFKQSLTMNSPEMLEQYSEALRRFGRALNRSLFGNAAQRNGKSILMVTDIAQMSVSSVVNPDASIRRQIVGLDGKKFDMCAITQTELKRYIMSRFNIKSLENLTLEQAAAPLFPTQKKPHFSANTLAQHFSFLDRAIHQHFKSTIEPIRLDTTAKHDTSFGKRKSLLSRLATSLA